MKTFIKEHPFYTYHLGWSILSIAAGIIFTGFQIYYDNNGSLSGAILGTIGLWILGTLCFLILPIAVLALGSIIKYFPVLALPIWIVLAFTTLFGEVNAVSIHGYWITLLVSVALSLFGLFNIVSAKIGAKEIGCDYDLDGMPVFPFSDN